MKPNYVQTNQLIFCQVDWVLKDDVSVEVGETDEGVVTLPVLKIGRPFAVEKVIRTVSKVPSFSLFLTVTIRTLITVLDTFFF